MKSSSTEAENWILLSPAHALVVLIERFVSLGHRCLAGVCDFSFSYTGYILLLCPVFEPGKPFRLGVKVRSLLSCESCP